MKHLKVFKTKAAYNQYKQAGDIEYPLTSYIEETDETIFDHWVPEGVVLYLDDCDTEEIPTPEDMADYAEWCDDRINEGTDYVNDRYYFIDEVIFDNVYYWLWYAGDIDNLGYYSYILTPSFNNYNDLRKHTALYNSRSKYSPISVKLTDDISFDEYNEQTAGFKDFSYNGKVLIDIKKKSYEKHSLPFVSPYRSDKSSSTLKAPVICVDALCEQGLAAMRDFDEIGETSPKDFFTNYYKHGSHNYYIGTGQYDARSAAYYKYAGTFIYDSEKYHIWEMSDKFGDYYNNMRYCLTTLSPDELYTKSMNFSFSNRYTNFIFLDADKEIYDFQLATRYLIDVFEDDYWKTYYDENYIDSADYYYLVDNNFNFEGENYQLWMLDGDTIDDGDIQLYLLTEQMPDYYEIKDATIEYDNSKWCLITEDNEMFYGWGSVHNDILIKATPEYLVLDKKGFIENL